MTEVQKDEYYSCPNRELARALAIAGVPFAPQKFGGPAVNTYSLGFVRQPRFKGRFAGKNLTDSAADCVAAKIHGDVTYRFVRGPLLDEVIAVWDAMAKERTQATADGRDPQMPSIPTAAIVQTLFVAANSEDEFRKVPFVNRMMQLASTMDGKSSDEPIEQNGKELPGRRTNVEGAGRVWSIHGSDKMKKHLEV